MKVVNMSSNSVFGYEGNGIYDGHEVTTIAVFYLDQAVYTPGKYDDLYNKALCKLSVRKNCNLKLEVRQVYVARVRRQEDIFVLKNCKAVERWTSGANPGHDLGCISFHNPGTYSGKHLENFLCR
ncbi:unnamed protein product [Cylicocyclus nassatus]|uniref:Uncharacterized protein n=1 Tax=Cylicocyclus nassatus TaxID=53992 RepID=A0AA36M6P0_CYLNA|nr:unnamed protein product [Cylicocyclus nassatus]